MKAKCCCSLKCRLISGGVVGAVLIIFGGTFMVIFNALYESVIKTQTSVVPGTLMYNLNWKNVSVPVYRSFYVFNVTNKDEFLAQRPGKFVKPILQQLGPYTYREYLVKDNVEYLEYNKTHPQEVSFKQTATFFFDPERSNGSEDDVVVTLNFLLPVFPSVFEYLFKPGPVLSAAYATFNALVRQTNSELLFTMTVGEYLFGFKDPLLTAILDNFFPNSSFEEFGLFLLTNMSVGWRDYQVYTGKNNYQMTNVITKFKNMSELPYWFGSTCNDINGTDGTMTPPFMKKEDPTYFYVDEMCRSLHAVYERDETVLNIKGWRFTVPPDVFQSPSNNPDNACFCGDPNHVNCQHDGALLLSPCLFNVPLLASFPHFLYGDGFYQSKLVGMHPNKEEHEMMIVYEPTTGLVVKTASRIQLNMLMTPHSDVKILQKINETFAFPMIWLNESALIPEDDARWVSKLLYKADDVALLLQIIIIVIGGLLLTVSLSHSIYLAWHKKGRSEQLPSFKKSQQKSSIRYNSARDDVFTTMKSKDGLRTRNDRYISTSSTANLVN